MLKRTMSTAMAFVGIVIGAGFATGQEVLQYFVSHGTMGIWGALVSGLVMIAAGTASLQLGSYFLANDHSVVLRRISHPVVARILDAGVLITLFCTGFVMFAGAGSNMQQQFGWPIWAGSLMMLILVLLTGLLNVDKVTNVIGAITPLIIVFVAMAVIYAIINSDADTAVLNSAASEINSATPNWLLSALNYVGLALMMGSSMSIIIGGNNFNPRAAGLGGMVGGLIYGVMMLISTWGLYSVVNRVGQDDVPMLTIVNMINPTLGLIMSIVIIGMIFNTAISMFYAFGKRATSSKPKLFYPVFAVSCVIGWGCSFMGFKTLVGVVYPILGYMGIFLAVIVGGAWMKSLAKIREERNRREKIHELVRRKLDPNLRFSSKQARQLQRYTEESVLETERIAESVREEVKEEIASAHDKETAEDAVPDAGDLKLPDHAGHRQYAEDPDAADSSK
ncbi:YkvI family membrane protein [Corynebacterium gerontici]|uniref:Membrane protein YkvI n=1 Tax=Corynebacterium gerontici TaxID=2079234 RepID=A0A3G6IZB8_9CORY|nr:hypothetical protein [Corynebacterium gerontici]AZA11037.1 hypothetical protein CGERO_03590 [Corynebacterium gerontici]